MTCEGRDFLRDSLNNKGIHAQGQFSNTLLVDLGDIVMAGRIVETLRKRGVYIKSGFPAPLDHHALVTCGSKPLMETFLDELLEAMKASKN